MGQTAGRTAERVRRRNETGGSPTTTANTLAPRCTCLLCVCVSLSCLAAISLCFLWPMSVEVTAPPPSHPLCVCLSLCVLMAAQNNTGRSFCQEEYFMEVKDSKNRHRRTSMYNESLLECGPNTSGCNTVCVGTNIQRRTRSIHSNKHTCMQQIHPPDT